MLRSLLLALLLLLSVDAKGGGRSSGGTTSASSRSSGYASSGGRYSSYSGRYTSSGAAVPSSCRGCYYGGSTGMFYNRIFIYSYLGTSYRCYSCGSRSGTGSSHYSEDSLTVALAAVRGKLTVKLRDQTGGDGATQLTLRDVNTTAAMSPGGIAFESSVRSKIVSDWAQWSAAVGTAAATAGSLGLASDVAITVATAPGSCTGPPPCEPLVDVSFLLLFEDPSDATTTRAAAHAAVLQTACGREAECSVCGVPANCGDAAACSSACSACATPCTDVLPSGRRKGPWDRQSACSAVENDPTHTVISCATFDATVLELSSELGDEIPYDEQEGDDGAGIIGFFLFICVLCTLCHVCKTVNKARQGGGRGSGRGGGRQQPDQQMAMVAMPSRGAPAGGAAFAAAGPPQQVEGVQMVSALPVHDVTMVSPDQVHAVPLVATATAVPMAKP